MTDYNDGNWHGWNGGKCPVHPNSEVEVRYEDSRYDGIVSGKGLDYGWEKYPNKRGICAFRVVKAYVEPREGWAVTLFSTAREAKTAYPGCTPIHVKEITE